VREPRRLLQSDQASPVLRDALRALERRGPGPEALARLRAALPTGAPVAGGGGSVAAEGGGGGGAGAGAAGGGGAGLGATGVTGAAGIGAASAAGAGLGLSHAVLLGVATTAALAVYGMNVWPSATKSEREATPAAGETRVSRAGKNDSSHALDSTKPANAIAASDDPRLLDARLGTRARRETSGDAVVEPNGSRALDTRSARAALDGPARSRSVAHSARAGRETSGGGVVEPSDSRALDSRSAEASNSDARPVTGTAAAAASQPTAVSEVATSSQRAETPRAAAERAAAPDSQPSAAAPQPAAKAELAPQDEAGLLYRAKRFAAHDPRAALRLLGSHAKYFPRGTLAEERDVLTIQLHRKLGDLTEAQRLATLFRAHYPTSIYLPSIAP